MGEHRRQRDLHVGGFWRRAAPPAAAAAVVLALLGGAGVGVLQALPSPHPSQRVAARAVGVIAGFYAVRSVVRVGNARDFGLVCLAGRRPRYSIIRFASRRIAVLTPKGGVMAPRIRLRRRMLAVAAMLAGCPRELERLLAQRIALRVERHEPLGLRAAVVDDVPMYSLRFLVGRATLWLLLDRLTLQPLEIRVRLGNLRGTSWLNPIPSFHGIRFGRLTAS